MQKTTVKIFNKFFMSYNGLAKYEILAPIAADPFPKLFGSGSSRKRDQKFIRVVPN